MKKTKTIRQLDLAASTVKKRGYMCPSRKVPGERPEIKPGDFYQDCSGHPCLCISSDYYNDDLCGISLVDGTHCSCSFVHCAPRKLKFGAAVRMRFVGPSVAEKAHAEGCVKYYGNHAEEYRMVERHSSMCWGEEE